MADYRGRDEREIWASFWALSKAHRRTSILLRAAASSQSQSPEFSNQSVSRRRRRRRGFLPQEQQGESVFRSHFTMGSRLGRRVVNFANLPIKLCMPSTFTNIKEIAIKTIPSASKIEIKRILESMYGFEVEKVQTLNRDGKKMRRGWLLLAKPDYKKAYITLKHPLSINSDLFPIRTIEEYKTSSGKKGKSSIVEEGEKKSHWLDRKDEDRSKQEKSLGKRNRGAGADSHTKFPWSYMKSGSGR